MKGSGASDATEAGTDGIGWMHRNELRKQRVAAFSHSRTSEAAEGKGIARINTIEGNLTI